MGAGAVLVGIAILSGGSRHLRGVHTPEPHTPAEAEALSTADAS
jgi:hypothetical protein